MNKKSYFILALFILLSLLLSAGCGMRIPFISPLLTDNDWPKKRIMIMPASNLTGIPFSEPMNTIIDEFTKILQKTGSFDLSSLENTHQFQSLTPGSSIDFELLTEAKKRGINAIIFGTLNPVEVNPGKAGIWPFRKKAWKCALSMNVDIVDVITGTILLSKEVADKITLSGEETTEEEQKEGTIETKQRALRKGLPRILKKAATAASHALNKELWAGRIVSIEEKKIIINAGSDAELKSGVVLEVFCEGQHITSFNDQTYQLPGQKVGEVKIVSLETRHSLTEPINGNGFKVGQIVRVKD